MNLSFKINGSSIEVNLTLNWRSTIAGLRALLPVITMLLSLLAAPEVARLGALLGWW
jgi:hypothetical protein